MVERHYKARIAGSATPVVVLLLFTLVIIIGSIILSRDDSKDPPLPQASQQVETQALYIAQTALDRSVKALVADPKWREGFNDVPFESGKFNVEVYDATTGKRASDTADIPPNYVRIVASSEIDGVMKQVEAVWVNAMSAFNYAYSAGDRIEIVTHRAKRAIVMGNLNNNSWNAGKLSIENGVTVYGNISSVGDITVGTPNEENPAVVYGGVWGSTVEIASAGEVRRFENLSEWSEGIDLNGDGDTSDIGLSRDPGPLAASAAFILGSRPLSNGDVDKQVAGGMLPVSVGGRGAGPIADPRPDFIAYYELVTGISSYPPTLDHVASPILGDGDGHYFSSAREFINWLNFLNETVLYCWRCAGDGRIDPGNTTECASCDGNGNVLGLEIAGVFYINDSTLDLSDLGRNLIIHGTVVVAAGDPYGWPVKTVDIPGGTATIDHFPESGRLILAGEQRMHFTVTFRSDEDGGSYVWSNRTLYSGEDVQVIPILTPVAGHEMRDFPTILAARDIEVTPRQAGFAYHPGDIGDEKLAVLQGVVYAENAITLHGRGGWSGETIVFDEEFTRREDDALDEAVVNVDLDGDGDVFDRVEISNISTVPVIPVSRQGYNVDINNDGVLGKVTIGVDYLEFFEQNDYMYPTLIYHEGTLLGQSIHSCEQVFVVHDPLIVQSGIPFGFEVSFGSTTYQGLVSWWEHGSP